MSSSARHARRKDTRPRTAAALLRAGLTVTAAGAVVAGAGGVASAEEATGKQPSAGAALEAGETALPVRAVGEGLHAGLAGALGPVKSLQLNPLAGTGSDPLDNAVGTQVADFKPVSTAALTGPLAEGASLEELPVAGEVVGLLPG